MPALNYVEDVLYHEKCVHLNITSTWSFLYVAPSAVQMQVLSMKCIYDSYAKM